jgi:RHS repeat-associated protein
MSKKGAHASLAHQLTAQFLVLTLLCQTLIAPAHASEELRRAEPHFNGRVTLPQPDAGAVPHAEGASAGGASQAVSCPAASSRPAASRLTYTGRVEGHCGEPLPVSARLADECGNALAGRQVSFKVGSLTASAATDDNGVASTSLLPPASASPLPLEVSFDGDADYAPARDSASVRVARAATSIRYTGPALLAVGVAESVSSVLTEPATGRPVPNVTLNFEVGSVRVSATTDANGVAAASVQIPPSETFAGAPLKVSFAGNDCHDPASASAEVTAYLRSSFVIWGGNAERIRLGQRVNFWGHSWAKQVSAGDYKAHNDFKGYADTVRQYQLCQVNVRTTSTPPLDNSCWSTKPGQSFPPETLPEHIGVIVTTSADKSGAPDFGNIAALVVVKVAPEPRYGAVPGKPGFGTIVAVIADGEGVFPRPPAVTLSQTQPAAVLPAESLNVVVTVANNSTGAATNVSVNESFTGLTPPNASAEVGNLPASGTQTRTFGATVPSLRPRAEGESSQAYQRRLGAADGTFYSARGLVSFRDDAGRAYEPVGTFSASRLRLPRLAVSISAAPCVSPGATIPYAVTLTNVGSTVAASASAAVTFPDGSSTRVETTNLEPGKVFSSTVNWTVPPVAAKGANESDADYLARLASFDGRALKASVSATWRDALGNAYGAVDQECSGVLRVPILSQTAQPPAPMLPGQKVTLTAAVRNTGSGNAPQARLRVNNPDASVFDAPPFSLPAGNSSDIPATLTAPPVAPKAQDETDEAYLTRLRSADNGPVDFSLALEWTDAAGNTYGPVGGALRTSVVLPIVLLSLSAPETIEAGETLAYRVTAENVGHAEANGQDLRLMLPGGQAQSVTLPVAALPPGDKQSAVVNFEVPAEQPEGQLTAQANVNWKDAAANGYGPVSAAAATNVMNPNRPPLVNAGPDQTVTMPATVTLNGAASDDGKPAGSTHTTLWTKVSGPGAVAFADAGQTITTASFGEPGTYILRLTASDSVLSAFDEATVVVEPPTTGPTYGETVDPTGGEGVNVVSDESNHLSLDNEASPFNFIWVAVSSKGTIVKIDTDTGQVLGEYLSSPTGQPKDPSRTTVDHNGNVWASNRAGNSVLRVALLENGQCVDRNRNGVIDTSKGFGDIRPWPNTGGVDTDGGVETAQDECIINYTRVRSSGTRHVSVNALNDVWVSGTGGERFDLIDSATGQIKRQEGPVGFGGYGGLIDKKGVIWSARPLLRWDTALPLKGANGGTWKGYGHDSYGLCIDSKGNVWNTSLGGNIVRKFAPDGTLVGTFDHGSNSAQGCVVDRNDHVWVAHSTNSRTVGRLKPDGTFIGNVTVGNGPTGVAVDAKGKVWATNHNSRNVSRIDPELGPMGADGVTRVGQVDLTTIDLKGSLYNYSDMTGSTLSGAPASGTWTRVFDSGIAGAEWGVIGWNGRACGDSALLVSVSSSTDGVNFSAPVAVSNGAGFSAPAGRYLKVSASFKRASSGESPFLFNLTLGTRGYSLPASENQPPTVDAGPDQTATMPNAANLAGTACDAGRLTGLAVSWEKVSGPGAVTFANAQVPATTATFGEAGEYVLRLTAGDSEHSSRDEMAVLVLPFNDPPAVNAGADQSVILPAAASLAGTVADDALPKDSSVAVSWSKLSGPGEVSFANSTVPSTSAAFSEPGDYVLRLIGDDSQLANVDEVSVKVYPPNSAPSVIVGGDRTIRLPDKAPLDATVTDDGLPLGKTVTFAWSKVSGPGTVSFAKASAADTTAAFSLPGTYVLRLTVSDSQLSASDELTVVVNPANQPPTANAGPDQTITLPDAANLSGAISDDDLPEGRTLTAAWSKVSGPGLVTFVNPNSPTTTATFSEPGAYVLRLTATDSALNRTDDVAVTAAPSPVNLPPNVNAGPDQAITLPAKAALAGVASDDRQPAGNTLALAWSKVSGPGNVTFAKASAAATTAAFSVAGTYVLRLTATDLALTTADEVAITVLPVNQPPTVKADTDQIISVPASASLSGTVTDDGLPAGGRLTVAWSKVSGPGEVSFADDAAASTTAAFSTGGKYVLRLTASDGELTRSDDVAVTVNQAPTAEAGPSRSVHLPTPAGLSGTVTDDALPPGKAIVVAWSKVNGPGNVTFAKTSVASTTAVFSAAGTYVLRLTANDSLLEASDEMTVNVLPPLPPPPSVAIHSPNDGAEIVSRVDIVGSVSHGTWKLEYSLGPDPARPGDGVWTTFASGSTPTANAVLATFDPTLLLNGTYAIRLSATDAAGQTTSVTRNSVVDGQQKVGNFTISLEDLNVPVAGLPIQLIRTYDSRDKRVGDFGVGWGLGIRNVRLEKSVELGRHWRGAVLPGSLPQYCLQPTRPNIVTITFPDDRVYKFQATTTKQCQAVVPIGFARFGFIPMPGTRGSLVPEAPLDVAVGGGFPGPVELLDSADPLLRTYDPTVFRFTDEDGTVFIIDQKLGVRSITDLNGNKLTINRDGIVHSSGKSVRFLRDSQGRITQIIDPLGNQMFYTYDAAGDLVGFKDREGSETTFTYNSTHGLLSIIDPRGVQPVRNEYDARGRLISHTDANGNKVTYANDLNSRQEVITDRLGNVTLSEYDARGNLLRMTDAVGAVTSYSYDARGNKLSETNAAGKTTRFTYDANDNLTSKTDPLGNVVRYTYNARKQALTQTDARGGVTTNTFDAKGNLVSFKDALGNVTTYTNTSAGVQASETDALGNVTRYEHDRAGNETEVTDALGQITTNTYDANGNHLSQTTSRTTSAGAVETLTVVNKYDREDRQLRTTYPDGTAMQLAYDPDGRLRAATDPAGYSTGYEYDAMGRLTKTVHPDGTTETTAYDAEGRRVSYTDRGGNITTYSYDPVGRPLKTVFADGSSRIHTFNAIGGLTQVTNGRGDTTRHEYDPNCGCRERRTRITDALNRTTSFTFDANGNRVTMTDANNQTVRYEYDLLDQETKAIYPNGSETTTSYDPTGNIVAKTDASGKVTRYAYDKVGRLTQVTDAPGQVTRYGYDEVGNRISQTDALNRTVRDEYDKLGRRIRRTLPLGMSETYTYNAAGALVSRTDFRGKTTAYSYDSMHRLIRKSPDASLGEAEVVYTYAANGERASMSDASGRTTYAYDARDRLVSKATPHGTLNYTYDATGNLLSTRSSNPGGAAVTYSYDALDRIMSVRDDRRAGALTRYSFDAAGNLSSFAYPNGVESTHQYNGADLLTDVTISSKGSAVASYSYTLGAMGERLTVTERNGRKVRYTYDHLYRLTSETVTGDPRPAANFTTSYTYDAVGNRLGRNSTLPSQPSANYTYDANNRLLGDSYDAAGNTTASKGNSYQYDSENRLKSVNEGQLGIVYDGDGNRVSQTAGGVTTHYLVDTNNPTGYPQVVEELVGNSVRRVYTYGYRLISQTQLIDGAWRTSFYGYDGHGSVALLTDEGGEVTDTYDYDAFGNLIAATGTTPNDYLYTGERRDPRTGLYHLRARYLNPETGRFWSSDPAEGDEWEPPTLHKYLYVNGDPVNNTDPTGLFTLAETKIALFFRGVLQRLANTRVYRALSKGFKNKKVDLYLAKQQIENMPNLRVKHWFIYANNFKQNGFFRKDTGIRYDIGIFETDVFGSGGLRSHLKFWDGYLKHHRSTMAKINRLGKPFKFARHNNGQWALWSSFVMFVAYASPDDVKQLRVPYSTLTINCWSWTAGAVVLGFGIQFLPIG